MCDESFSGLIACKLLQRKTLSKQNNFFNDKNNDKNSGIFVNSAAKTKKSAVITCFRQKISENKKTIKKRLFFNEKQV